MRILVISTNIFAIPPSGYSGLEMLTFNWSVEFQKAGHQVSVVAPEGSTLPEGIELIATKLGESEQESWARYKDRMMTGAWDAIMDSSWNWFTTLSQMEASKQLPVVRVYHSDPRNCDPNRPPPIEKPCLVAFSKAQAEIMNQRWRVVCRYAYHGIDTKFYSPDPAVERGNRYLFLARYTPEKGFLEVSALARKCKVGLDAYGDTTIIGPNQQYAEKCFTENDGMQIKVNPGIPRLETVKQFRSHKALITWPNFIEAFGLTTVESMNCGCPVISYDSGAARELIIQGKTGFVVNSFEEAVELIQTDAVSRLKTKDIVAQGKKFTIQKSAKHHLGFLQDVADGFYW